MFLARKFYFAFFLTFMNFTSKQVLKNKMYKKNNTSQGVKLFNLHTFIKKHGTCEINSRR